VVAPRPASTPSRTLPCSKEVVFSTECHMLPNESVALAARKILAFLRRHPGGHTIPTARK